MARPPSKSDSKPLRGEKVVIVGAGVIGVTSAYYLAQGGAEVEVIDKRSSSAAYGSASHQNGGLLCYGAVEPWSSPSALAQLKASLTQRNSPILVRFGTYLLNPQFYNWAKLFWKYCSESEADYRKRCVGIFNLSYLSAEKMAELRNEFPQLRTANASAGTLSLYSHLKAYQADYGFTSVFKSEINLPKPISVNEAASAERASVSEVIQRRYIPALSRAYGSQLEGAILNAEDSSGDCRLFTKSLVDVCTDMGVKFRYEEALEQIEVRDDTVIALVTDKGKIEADKFVFCAGTVVTELLKIGVNAPIFPMKGYSLNVPIRNISSSALPPVAIVDEEGKKFVSRIGNNIRISGFAELHGFDGELREDRKEQLVAYLKSILREEDLDWEQSSFYTCHRPVAADDIPLIGPTRQFKNLFVNLGHGSKGWTLAAGSASLLAKLIAKEKCEIDPEPFNPARFPPLSSSFVSAVNRWPNQ